MWQIKGEPVWNPLSVVEGLDEEMAHNNESSCISQLRNGSHRAALIILGNVLIRSSH